MQMGRWRGHHSRHVEDGGRRFSCGVMKMELVVWDLL